MKEATHGKGKISQSQLIMYLSLQLKLCCWHFGYCRCYLGFIAKYILPRSSNHIYNRFLLLTFLFRATFSIFLLLYFIGVQIVSREKHVNATLRTSQWQVVPTDPPLTFPQTRTLSMDLTYVRVHVPSSTEAAAVRALIDLTRNNTYDLDSWEGTHSDCI